MTFLQIAFYFFAVVMVLSATMVITMRDPVKSALFLVLTFFSGACVWMTLEAEFLAIVLVLVYVGAVMVLFLFVVMMLDINLARLRAGFTDYLVIGGLIGLLLVVELAFILNGDSFSALNLPRPVGHVLPYSNTRELGMVLYTYYVYPFEIAAVVLLVAIVAAISLTMRKRPDSKYQDPAEQVVVRPEDRVRLVKMSAERPASRDKTS